MLNKYSFFLVAILMTSFGNLAHAMIGSKEEAIRSALEDREPPYIMHVTEQLSRALQNSVPNNGGSTARQKLTVLVTAAAIMRLSVDAAENEGKVAYNIVRQAVQEKCRENKCLWENGVYIIEEGPNMASNAVSNTAQNADLKVATAAIIKAAKSTAGEEVLMAVIYGMQQIYKDKNSTYAAVSEAATKGLEEGATYEQIGKITYRVAEWIANNFYLEQENIKNRSDAAIKSLPEYPPNNIFENNANEGAWQRFENAFFADLASGPKLCLGPVIKMLKELYGQPNIAF